MYTIERLRRSVCNANELTKPSINIVGLFSLDIHGIIAKVLDCGSDREVLVCETDVSGKRECRRVYDREDNSSQKLRDS